MRAEGAVIGRNVVTRAAVLLLLAGACTSEDVGSSDKSGTGATSGAGVPAAGGSGRAAGGAAGIDTAGSRATTDRAGSVVAPGPGKVPGTPGTAAGDSAAGKGKGARP